MKINLLFFIIINLLFNQTISIKPQLKYSYETDSEQYNSKQLPIHDYDFVLTGQYKYNNLYVLGKIGYHLVDGTLLNPTPFTKNQGMQYFVKDKGLNNQKNYYIADMKMEYNNNNILFYLNKWDKHWGPGINSLTISNKIPSFFHFGYKWKLKSNIDFEYFHGKLKSNVNDTLYGNYYNYIGSRNIDINRNIVGHRIEWKPYDQLIISASELIIYANREIEITYMIPFVPFFPLQAYLGETDNVMMGLDIKYSLYDNIHMYGEFFMDEWAPSYTFKKDNNNWFGYLAGLEWNNIILQNRFRIEFTWTDHRLYRHRFPVNDHYSWGYPVGFWAGPHAQEIYLDYNFIFLDNSFEISFSDAKRGELTYEMLENQYSYPDENRIIYERFAGITEQKKILNLSIMRELTSKLDLKLSYTYTDWINAGFIPQNISGNLMNIKKYSLGLDVLYNY